MRRYLATGDDYEYIAEMSEDPNVKREIILEADAETLARMRKEGHVRGFTVYAAQRIQALENFRAAKTP